MTTIGLPEDGELRLGSVRLPAGRRSHALGYPDGSTTPVAWVTTALVPDPGQVWLDLSDAARDAGLVPFLAAHMRGDRRRPWSDGIAADLEYPADVTQIEHLDADGVLRERRNRGAPDFDDEDESARAWAAERSAPFSRDFPGLAPATSERLTSAELRNALRLPPRARIGLAAASRPADALPAMGWKPANWIDGVLPVATVLRSWEDRFGARLLEVGIDQFTLLVDRPPRSAQAAERIAAELYSFADEVSCGGKKGLNEVPSIAAHLVDSPTWGFWWD
jgi:hypothetical protein